MRFAYSLLGVVAVVQVLGFLMVGSWSPGLVIGAIVMLVVGAIIAFAGRAIAVAVARRGGRRGVPPGLVTVGTSILSPRVLSVTLATGVAFVVVPKYLGDVSPLLSILTEFVLLLLAGVLLGGWCQAAGWVPVVVAVIVRLADAGDAVKDLLSTPGMRFQLGPELPLFAVQRYSAVLVWLPLDLALVFSAWKIAGAMRGARGAPAAPAVTPDGA